MRKFVLLSALLIMFIGFNSCNKVKKQIVGTWTKYEQNDTITVSYSDGESIKVNSPDYITSGHYWFESTDTQEDVKIYITTDDCDGVSTYHPIVDGKNLTMRVNYDTCAKRKEKIGGDFVKE